MEESRTAACASGKLLRNLYLLTGTVAAAFSALIAGSFAWDLRHEHLELIDLARREAVATVKKDLTFRSWATKHGGVYVPVTAETPPNPYLKQIPERDIVTPSGRRLTLMNPAYMMRQTMQLYSELGGVKGRLTSLNALNPENAPDPWERIALGRLERGEKEVTEIVALDNKPYLRFMQPMITGEGCLKCHAAQGYREGDIRGGLSVSVPLAPYLAFEKEAQRAQTASYLFIWLLGMTGIGYGFFKGKAVISERQQAEIKLRKSEAGLRTLFQTVPDLIWLKNAEGIYLTCNTMFERFFGAREAAIIGKTDYDFVDRELADFFREHDRKAMTAGKPSSNEEWITFADDGHRALLHTIKTPMFDAGGKLIGVLGIGHDITAFKRTEEELLKFSAAIEQCPVSIVITDTQGNIEFVNPKFTQLTGYTLKEALGQNPRILKTGETPPELYRELWSTISSGKVWLGEFHNRKKNGELFWEYATISPVKDLQGEITNYIAIKEDITERRNLENQLRQAQKMEAVGTLTGGIAHDFNNILSAIIGFGSLLEMKMAKDDPLHDNVIQILAAADRAAILVRSMLAFSRKQVIEVKPVILNDIIAGIEKMLRRLIREDIELRIRLTDETLTALADAGQIEQVLLNLTTNAKDSMPVGGTIIITTEQAELDESFRNSHGYGEPGSYALITFADNGNGMEKSVQERIFEPFFTTKAVGKGTGLGLAVCYGIIKQHHGFIICYSEPGRGTTFRIYLPLSRSAAGQNNAAAELPITGGTETILVAEDDANVRNLTTSILTEFGYTVIEAQDGAEAVARFVERSDEIQLCLFDMIMPKKSGQDAYEEIRKLRSGIKILFMSGYQAEISGHEGLVQAGAALITKPVAPKELLKRVREVLDR